MYFWLLPAYVIWYTVLPRVAGGKLFSEPLGRLVFALFILLSTPVGFHHQFMDPGIPAEWKLFHAFNTMLILFPSFVTAFTVIASLEIAGRLRGGTGLFGWIGALPWRDPLVSSVILSMLLFAVGGFGGAINASFGMNSVVHNTSWIPGHFHTTVGSASALTFMGACYLVVPSLLGRRLELAPMARVQPWLWFVGMLLFSIPTHASGMLGMPRRVYDPSYGGHPVAVSWRWLTDISAIGGMRALRERAVLCAGDDLHDVRRASAVGGAGIRRSAGASGHQGRDVRSTWGAGAGRGGVGPGRLRVPDLAPPADATVRVARLLAVLDEAPNQRFEIGAQTGFSSLNFSIRYRIWSRLRPSSVAARVWFQPLRCSA